MGRCRGWVGSRKKTPDVPRPYRCTGYPGRTAIYVLVGTAWTLNTIIRRPTEAFWGATIVLIGVPGYLYWKRSGRRISASGEFHVRAIHGKGAQSDFLRPLRGKSVWFSAHSDQPHP